MLSSYPNTGEIQVCLFNSKFQNIISILFSFAIIQINLDAPSLSFFIKLYCETFEVRQRNDACSLCDVTYATEWMLISTANVLHGPLVYTPESFAQNVSKCLG